LTQFIVDRLHEKITADTLASEKQMQELVYFDRNILPDRVA